MSNPSRFDTMTSIDQNNSASGRSDFSRDARELWRRLPDKALFLGLLLAWLGLFQFLGNSTFGHVDSPSLFVWMYEVCNSPFNDDQHAFLIPLAVLALFWWKRQDLIAVPKKNWWPALLILLAALFLHLVGYMVQQQRLSVAGLFLGIYGLMGVVWGRAWLKASFFPFVLFVFCIPVGSLSESVTFPLRILVTKISVAIGHGILGIDVVRDGTMIFDEQHTFRYDVAPACSGIRSLVALLALTTIYGFMTFTTGWKRLVMVVLALPLAVLGNVLRLIGVIVAAEAFGQNAGAFAEQKLGFLTFTVAIIGVLLVSHWLRERKTVDASPAAPRPLEAEPI